MSDCSLQIGSILLLVQRHTLERLELIQNLVTFILQLLKLLRLVLQLSCQVINMSFQSQDFLYEVFFFLVELLQLKVLPTQILIRILQLNV